jgi:hypothetical protein
MTAFISFSVRVWYSSVFFVIGSHAEIKYNAISGIIIGCQSEVEASVADALSPILAPHEL